MPVVLRLLAFFNLEPACPKLCVFEGLAHIAQGAQFYAQI